MKIIEILLHTQNQGSFSTTVEFVDFVLTEKYIKQLVQDHLYLNVKNIELLPSWTPTEEQIQNLRNLEQEIKQQLSQFVGQPFNGKIGPLNS